MSEFVLDVYQWWQFQRDCYQEIDQICGQVPDGLAVGCSHVVEGECIGQFTPVDRDDITRTFNVKNNFQTNFSNKM